MNVFLIDNNEVKSYEAFVADLNGRNYYCPVYKDSDLYGYFVNFVKALISDCPVILIDSDLREEEVLGLDVPEKVNEKVKLSGPYISSVEVMLQYLLHSGSEVTIFTSGTTGQPKRVVHTIHSLIRNVRISAGFAGQTWGFAYNPTHMAGLQVFFQVIANLGTFVNVFTKSREQILQAISEYQITHISATPTFYRLLLPFEKQFTTVERVTMGGEMSDRKLHETIRQLFPNAKLNNIYASTEAGALFAAKGENFQIPDNIKGKIRIEENELLIHQSLLGKSDSFQLSADYYHTGDLVEWVDSELGLFRFKSRKNELINVGGYKLNPHEIEEALLAVDGVNEALVFGKSNSVLGNILCAEIKKDERSLLTEQDIRKILSVKLQDFKIPRIIKFVSGFTLTRTGKIKRI